MNLQNETRIQFHADISPHHAFFLSPQAPLFLPLHCPQGFPSHWPPSFFLSNPHMLPPPSTPNTKAEQKKNIFLSTHSLGIRLFPLLLQALSSSSSPPSPSLVVPPMLADKVTVVILSIFKHILQETQHQIIPGSHGNKGKPLALGHQ